MSSNAPILRWNSSAWSFLQNEKDAFLAFQLYDHRISPARDAAAIEVSGDFQKTLAVQGEGGKRLKHIRFPLETRLVKGEYKGKIKVTGNGKTNTFPFTFNICTRSEERMPFLFWLMNSPDVEQLYGAVRDAGFNCGTYGFYGDIRKEEVSRKLLNLMDRMLIDGFLYGHYTLPPYSVEQKYLRVNLRRQNGRQEHGSLQSAGSSGMSGRVEGRRGILQQSSRLRIPDHLVGSPRQLLSVVRRLRAGSFPQIRRL